jgi:hypothetical protein
MFALVAVSEAARLLGWYVSSTHTLEREADAVIGRDTPISHSSGMKKVFRIVCRPSKRLVQEILEAAEPSQSSLVQVVLLIQRLFRLNGLV